MLSKISVYLFPDTAAHIIKDDNLILKNIEKDTSTKIEYNKKKYDSYFVIDGDFENVHRARIILQEIEKDIYRECYLNHYSK
jgi:hypothetical protein